MSKLTRWAITVGAVVALVVPFGAADGDADWRGKDRRVFYATDIGGNLLRFDSRSPRDVRSKAITGLPSGVALSGIDFRPATGDLSALGSRQGPTSRAPSSDGARPSSGPSISPRARRGRSAASARA